MTQKLKTVNIQGKPYVMVHERIGEFHRKYPKGSISTKILTDLNSASIIIKATAKTDDGRVFTGHAQERVGDGFINKASALENAETSAIGRCLGILNIGILDGVASADEVVKAKDLSKSPDLNRPSPEQKKEIMKLALELDYSMTPDDMEDFNALCLEAIGTPQPLNSEQAEIVLAALREKILDKEAKDAEERDEG